MPVSASIGFWTSVVGDVAETKLTASDFAASLRIEAGLELPETAQLQ
ncbi:MAG TPA: hypothetical protein VHW09_01395 [Bryobacteraceae bacterium]|jgi:hypothetical protein|nr:hypothetical protein [Bryobacteraceae bacterium]